jgi:acetamidase/formamidase
MQHFPAVDARYAYSPHHAAIGSVASGEPFAVDCVEGWSNYFRAPEDFTPERHHAAEAVKWAVTGPITVAGATAGGAVAVTIRSIEITTPGVAVYGPYAEDVDPLAWWDDETGVALYPCVDGTVRFDDRTTLVARPIVGCLAAVPADGERHAMLQGRYGGNMDCKLLSAGATLVLPSEQAGAGLYFGDCKGLMGDGEIVAPPEVGAVVTASAEARERPPEMTWPRLETATHITTLVSGNPLEWAARQAFRELLAWITSDYDLSRRRAALLLAMVADTGICQVSNTECTAYCTVPRDVLAPYRR